MLLFLAAIQPMDDRIELERMLARYAALRSVEMTISKAARDQADQAMVPTISARLLLQSPNRFRYETSEYWGGSTTYVSDGKALLMVGSDGQPSRLRHAGRTVMTSHPTLSPGASGFAMTLLFLEGKSAINRLLPPGGRVYRRGNHLELQTREFGHMTLYLRNGLAEEITFDNRPNRAAAYRMMPMFYEVPSSPLEVEAVSFRRTSFEPNAFRTTTSKGDPVIDERKKPPKG